MENQNELVASRSELVDQLLEHIVCFGGFTADFSSPNGSDLQIVVDNEGDREAVVAILDEQVVVSKGSTGTISGLMWRERKTTEELVDFILSEIFD